MHPSVFGKQSPDTVCAIFAEEGTTLTYGELERDANRGARFLRSLGLRAGDALVFCLENDASFFAVSLAAQRIGVYFTPVSTRATAQELAYIAADSKAGVVVLASERAASMPELASLIDAGVHRIACGPGVAGYLGWAQAIAAFDAGPLPDPACGEVQLYSSGTTGKPKGIRRAAMTRPYDSADPRIAGLMASCNTGTVMLSTSPLYHSAPFRYASAVLATGGRLVVMRRFEPELALALIERHACNTSLWVPTMFSRLLRLPPATRARYRLSSMTHAAHGAAPCPVYVKEAMIAWWGPVLYEVYAGTEGVGTCAITSQEWLLHKGSVGRSLQHPIHILDDAWRELPTGAVGTIYFESDGNFSYHGDPAKTDQVTSPQGWRTYGDLGYVDDDGYLYLTGRKSFTIITGGVNVYPQEVEDVLGAHPAVADCAVFGVPDDDLGERVIAVVQPLAPDAADPALGQALIAWCRGKLSAIKCPRTIHFDAALPREPNGKLYKLPLQQRYSQLPHPPRSPMPDQPVLYEEQGHIAIITLNAPDKNLFSDAVVEGLHAAFCRLEAGDARVGVICAKGANFTMGADLHGFPKDIARSIPGAGAPSGKPLVAAVNGWCLGAAMTLVQTCDLCVAADTTRFLYPEARLGVSMGMIAGLAARIPHKVAMEVMLLGGVLTAQRAYEVGLVNRVVPEGQQFEAAMEYARTLAGNAPLVISRLRKLVGRVVPESPAVDAYRMQRELDGMVGSEDMKEGMASLVEKRTARFSGR